MTGALVQSVVQHHKLISYNACSFLPISSHYKLCFPTDFFVTHAVFNSVRKLACCRLLSALYSLPLPCFQTRVLLNALFTASSHSFIPVHRISNSISAIAFPDPFFLQFTFPLSTISAICFTDCCFL